MVHVVQLQTAAAASVIVVSAAVLNDGHPLKSGLLIPLSPRAVQPSFQAGSWGNGSFSQPTFADRLFYTPVFARSIESSPSSRFGEDTTHSALCTLHLFSSSTHACSVSRSQQ